MIDEINGIYLSDKQRRDILARAMYSQPFYHQSVFPLGASAVKEQSYQNKVDVNKDFYLTEIRGNFGEAFTDTTSLFNLSLYSTLNDESVWKFLQSIALPSGQIAMECRFDTAFANQLFDDRQFEYFPYLVRGGDRLIAKIQNLTTKTEAGEINLVLAGYYPYVSRYLTETHTRGINESLVSPVRYELWKQTVNHEGQKTYNFKNDRTARLVIGFGIVDKNTDKGDLSESTILITDTFRELKFMNDPMPVEMFAPRLTCLRDTHQYLMPVEYLLEPFTALKCEIVNTLNGGAGYELVMLTRTV